MTTETERVAMKVINRLPELLAEKFGGEEHINLKQLQRDTELSYPTVLSWAKGRVVVPRVD